MSLLLLERREPAPAPPSPKPPVIKVYKPEEALWVPGNQAGTFAGTPDGDILHATRSPTDRDPVAEFWGTISYVKQGAGGLGWNVTLGPDMVAEHIKPGGWGWDARGSSSKRLGSELSQSGYGNWVIGDGIVRAFAWWWVEKVLPAYPRIRFYLPTHAEVDGTPEYGVYDGKTDTFPRGDPRADELRSRIADRLASYYGIKY